MLTRASRVRKKVIPIGSAPDAERRYPDQTRIVKEELQRTGGTISRNHQQFWYLRNASRSDGDVYEWLKARELLPGDERHTTA